MTELREPQKVLDRAGGRPVAIRVMQVCLDLHGVTLLIDTITIGQIIVRTAQGQFDAAELGHWLRQRA